MDNNITDLTVDIGEVVIDSFLNDGLLKDIPILGTGIKIIRISTNISDALLLNKLKLFMENLNIIKQDDVEKFKEKMNNDKFQKEVGIKLLNIIDKADEYIKIKWIAKVFLDYLDKKINKEFFYRIITIINNAFVQDILKLRCFEIKKEILSNNKVVESYILHQLFSNGLLNNHGLDGGIFTETNEEGDNGTIYTVNDFGNYILRKLL
jgi:hypothetical protein